ncbi:hypothetical protein TNCV_3071521 [Trichonephila clavipes]|nr:hypothetical protein TNCV_3071521 [Trichonephila clavipes]
MTTARLKTYNVHRAIGAQRARDQMDRDRQERPKIKRSKKELRGEKREVQKESERARRGLDLRDPFLEAPLARDLIRGPSIYEIRFQAFAEETEKISSCSFAQDLMITINAKPDSFRLFAAP